MKTALSLLRCLAFGAPLLLLSQCSEGNNRACRAYCDSLCHALSGCGVTSVSPHCSDECTDGLGEADCSDTRPPDQLRCTELGERYACASYCVTLCAQAAACGPLDEDLCLKGCAPRPVLCNARSVAARTCDPLTREARLYEDRGRPLSDDDVYISPGFQQPSAYALCTNADGCEEGLGCSAQTNTCVPCSSDAECDRGRNYEHFLCSAEQRCVEVACLIDEDCLGRRCDPAAHACVECTRDEHCTSALYPRCDAATNDCKQCLSNDDCPLDSRPRCAESKYCESCETNADCAGHGSPVCSIFGCVECASDADCKDPARPVCNTVSNACTNTAGL